MKLCVTIDVQYIRCELCEDIKNNYKYKYVTKYLRKSFVCHAITLCQSSSFPIFYSMHISCLHVKECVTHDRVTWEEGPAANLADLNRYSTISFNGN